MTLDVEVPDPPQLSNRGVPSEFESVEAAGGAAALRREELESILGTGAWREAFTEWATYTDLAAAEYQVLLDLDLLQAIDLYWDPEQARLRFEAPEIPDDWAARTGAAPADPGQLPSRLAAELLDLGDTLIEVLEDGYIDWGGEGPEDPVWSEETFGHGISE